MIVRLTTFIFVGLILVVLAVQASSLYTFPQPDGSRWWGDETCQMLELKTELSSGFARIPTGLGSSVAVTNGIVRGNSWLAAAGYGVPAILFSNAADVVTIGRTVTFILSLILCLVMFRMMRAFDLSEPVALFAMLVLVTTRSFLFASHAARLDIAAGISVLAFVWYLSNRFARMQQGTWAPTTLWFFLYGIVAILFATLSIHLLTLLGLLSIYMLWRFGAMKKPMQMMTAVGGVVIAISALLLVYKMSGAPFTMFGITARPNQFQSVASMLPIERPFSRSVQIANILERVHGLWSEAPQVVILYLLCIVSIIAVRKKPNAAHDRRFAVGATIVIVIAWLLFESPALYYYVQVLPLTIVATLSVIAGRMRRINPILLGLAVIPLAFFSVRDARTAGFVSSKVVQEDKTAIHSALSYIRKEAGQYRPVVLAQNPAIATLEHESGVSLMTAHFVSFPVENKSVTKTMLDLHVSYVILYAPGDRQNYSEDYAALRPAADSIGSIVGRWPGHLLDVKLNYFDSRLLAERTNDTLLLYKLPSSDSQLAIINHLLAR